MVTMGRNGDGLVRVGMLGCGNVGTALVRLLDANADLITRRSGVRIEVARVAVQNLTKDRAIAFAPGVLTNDGEAVVSDPAVDVIVEMIGGVEPARSLITNALKAGKPVVTANKELIANFGAELFEVAATAGVDLLFEASVAGGIPLIRPLRESLVGERIRRVTGIVNGTTNYVLTRMTEERCSFAEAVAEAQELGYAEPDPTADVDGFDAASKAAIIASIAFGARVVAGDVSREGIRGVGADDILAAEELGYVVKLLAVTEESDGSVSARVHPAMVPAGHPLASVSGSYNAVFIEGEAVGQLMLLGRGAGGGPTSSARARRPHRRREEPALRRARRHDRGARAAPHPPDRRDVVAVLRLARRRRPSRRARRDLRRVRHARRVDPVDAAEGAGRRCSVDLRHTRRPRGRHGGDDPRGARPRRRGAGRLRDAGGRGRRMSERRVASMAPRSEQSPSGPAESGKA